MDNEVFQIAFPGMTIDEDATFDKLEKELKTAFLYKRLGFNRREAVTTPSYEVNESGTNSARTISKQTENIAIHNIDGEDRSKQTYERVTYAIGRLKHVHQRIITTRFMTEPEPSDLSVWLDLNLSERTYYRIKIEAMSELAYALRLEVVIE
ncbi:ArpU family phage transcriptional regulator [Paenibacillus sp. DS2015]|uniref:ArpU family phage packaging/lysis transcriptional regulator n=1 Tax=Paenibacillus sp. DS2015 TaxID=3373917 RepID=UPI003D1B555C